ENIAARYANVKKEVSSIMGGKVLEYEAKTILKKGIREGKINTYVELIKDGLLSISEAAKRLEMSEDELKKYL
ncbi:MAG: hypothetical protein UHW97_03410, partial [Frisingicoccus sp.]|nr:hypothetical protein [Frisingicoccus sp.]